MATVDSTVVVDKAVLDENDLEILANTQQYVMVLNHLVRFGSITGEEARRYYGITRLPARIWEIKYRYKLPVNIRVENIKGKNRFGKEVMFAKYILED